MKIKRNLTLWLVAAVVILLIAAALTLYFINDFTLNLTLEGSQEITLEYGETYREYGAEANFSGKLFYKKPIPVDVKIQGSVQSEKLGTYTVTYTAAKWLQKQTLTRTVQIVDTLPPVISLTKDPQKYTMPGAPYEEEGFQAVDRHDGDLTDRVQRTEKNGVVTYTVTDDAGNTATAERVIVYNDPIPPELTLKGGNVELLAGEPYKEPGFSAFDNCDGDISDRVQITGGPDVYRPGVQIVTYTVTDSYNNSVSATRQVTVRPRPAAGDAGSSGKVIYLTFDDGPSAHTAELLDVLKRYNVKATFFVVNTGYIGMIKRAAAEGHTVAMHTATHDFKTVYASEEAYFADLYRMQSIIEKYTGISPMILRFPGGSSNNISSFNKGIMTRLAKAVKDKGMRYFDWNVDSMDAGGARSADEVFWNVVRGIGSKQYAIVLQHDTHGFSVDAVESIINWGLANGYSFAPLTVNSPVCEHYIYN